jgi:hypothetical protein
MELSVCNVCNIYEIIKTNSNIPPDVNPLSNNANKDTPSMYWIKFHKTEPPQCLQHDPTIRGENGDTQAMYWVKYINTCPPHYLQHDPTLQNNHNDTMAFYWIEYTAINEPLPEFMQHSSSLQGAFGETLAMRWIKFRKLEPLPEWMQHPPPLTNDNGMTFAMLWLEYFKTDYPPWSKHDTRLTDKRGRTVHAIRAGVYRSRDVLLANYAAEPERETNFERLMRLDVPVVVKMERHTDEHGRASFRVAPGQPLPAWVVEQKRMEREARDREITAINLELELDMKILVEKAKAETIINARVQAQTEPCCCILI